MIKYKYEKFQTKPGRKNYILSQHNGDDWAGPVVEHFCKENATKIGIYSADRKYLFELAILNPKGTEYTIKMFKDGYPCGPMAIMYNKSLYFGRYYAKDGFNGMVYCIRESEPIRIQEYKHGILVDECLDKRVLHENFCIPLSFDCFYETEELVEKKKNIKGVDCIDYIAGDPTSHQTILACRVDAKENILMGQYKNLEFDGLTMKYDSETELCTIVFKNNGKDSNHFRILYQPDLKGYSFVVKKNTGEYTSIVFREDKNGIIANVVDLDKKENLLKEYSLPTKIDPNAEKPYGNVKKVPKLTLDSAGKTAMQKLNEMIGLKNVKSEILKLKAILAKSPDKNPNLNMVFYGNPGTGKTEVARLLAQILYEEGILNSNKVVETDRSGLVGKYIGETAIKAHNIFKSALGGVLFIDEAYSLLTDGGDSFGKEAIDALIADMENYRGKICVILAGYKNDMDKMLKANKGFKSRISRYFDFEDYTKDELKDIAKLLISKEGYSVSDELLEDIAKEIEKKKFSDEFANAREVRNFVEKLIEAQAARTIGINKKDYIITQDDFENVVKKTTSKKYGDLTAIERLKGLIGLDNVKKEILKLQAILAKNKGLPNKTNLHMCFYGNPGTGKTEVARLFAQILYDEGILPDNKVIETDRSGLVAAYTGQTAIKTHDKVKEALGGVLFIDEAYSLSTDSSDSFGKEAIDALIADMENYRGSFCVILAGYEKSMEEMLSVNPGFKSRINKNIVFPDYSPEELIKIAKLMFQKKGYTYKEDVIEELQKVFSFEMMQDGFANARTVRNVLEECIANQALRTFQGEDAESREINIEDVKVYEEEHGIEFIEKEEKDSEDSKASKDSMHSDFNLKISDFIDYSENYNENSFKLSSDYIEESSVLVGAIKDNDILGTGTGFFISPKGVIVTCAHVVENADELIVRTNVKTSKGSYVNVEYSAEVIIMNSDLDIAVIGLKDLDFEFSYYPLERKGAKYPDLLTEITMGGYPFADRFKNISITEGKIQSINVDAFCGKNVDLYVDLSGHPGGSGSGIIDNKTGRCIGIFCGAATQKYKDTTLTINKAVPIQYLWLMLDEYNQGIKIIKNGTFKEKNNITNAVVKNVVRDADLWEHIHIVKGDITTFTGDAIVNAANQYLSPGAGVCGAIFNKAGYEELEAECQKIGGCKIGSAVLTSGYNLSAKHIIHAVGPRYSIDNNPEELLANTYKKILDIAIKNELTSVAIPSISTGIYKFPIELAVPIALKEISKKAKEVGNVYIYCFDDKTHRCYLDCIDKLKYGRTKE